MNRLKELIITIDWMLGDVMYFDDDTREVVIDCSENEIYKRVSNSSKDLKFLGEAEIRKYIHMAFTDFNTFSKLKQNLNAYA